MEATNIESTMQRPEADRVIDGPLVEINLPFFIEKIKQESTWKQSDRNAITIYKTNGFRLVLVALHKNTLIASHYADGIISIQVLGGKIAFRTDEQNLELEKGRIVVLHERIPHSISAIEESLFLLTLTTSAHEDSIF